MKNRKYDKKIEEYLKQGNKYLNGNFDPSELEDEKFHGDELNQNDGNEIQEDALDEASDEEQFNEKQFYRAIVNFSNAIALESNCIEALNGRALAYFKLAIYFYSEECEKALEFYQKAINDLTLVKTIDPYCASAYLTLAKIYIDLKGTDYSLNDALMWQYANKARELDPKNDEAWVLCGEICIMQNEWSNAMTFFTEALAINPENSVAYQCRADVHHHYNRMDFARADYFQMLIHDVTNPNSVDIATNHLNYIQLSDKISRYGDDQQNKSIEQKIKILNQQIKFLEQALDEETPLGDYFVQSECPPDLMKLLKDMAASLSEMKQKYYRIVNSIRFNASNSNTNSSASAVERNQQVKLPDQDDSNRVASEEVVDITSQNLMKKN